MARRAKEHYWRRFCNEHHHEVLITCDGEAGLQRTLTLCPKYPGHKEFIPVTDFNEDYFPACLKDDDVVNMIKAQCEITVRVSLKFDSSETNLQNPQAVNTPSDLATEQVMNRGMKTGSGWVFNVEKYPETNENLCECEDCRASGNPKRIAGKVGIKTAAHVVSNSSEAKNVTCHFFYDTPEIKLDTVPTLSGKEFLYIDTNGDWCKMDYETHNMDLIERLLAAWEIFKETQRKVYQKFGNGYFDSRTSDPIPKMAVIVSHPHGSWKYISFGYWNDNQGEKNAEDLTQYTYTTPTCPGSSGALVNMLGSSSSRCYHPHYGVTEISGLNRSCLGLDGFSTSCKLLDDFHTDKMPSLTLRDLAKHVVDFAKDERGSHFIVQHLSSAPEEDKNMVFEEICDTYFLMTHMYGHGIFEKFLEIGSQAQKEKLAAKIQTSFIRLSCDEYGSKLAMKALASLTPGRQITFVKELSGHVVEVAKEQYGSQIVQKCFECVAVDSTHLQFILDACKGQMLDLSIDEYGSQFVKYLLLRSERTQMEQLLQELVESTLALAEDAYGNELLQTMLKNFPSDQISPMMDKLLKSQESLARHQYGSEVIQCLLEHCSSEQRHLSIEGFRGHILQLAQEKHGCYVVQCIVKFGLKEQVESVIRELHGQRNELAKSPFRLKVINCLQAHGYTPP